MTVAPDAVVAGRYAASNELFARAQQSLAGGVSTAFRVMERPVPLFFKEAAGAHLVDVDGNDYVDYVCGFGPVVLGHGDARVVEAVARAAGQVQQSGGQHLAEVELAELLCELVPSFEQVRFSLSGSEAIHGAVRLARAATGRPLIVKFAGHYHGWLDTMFVSTGGPAPALADSLGQPAGAFSEIVLCDWNDPEALRSLFARAGDRIAGVIMEALPCNQGVIEPRDGYLELARELTRAHGAVLIFDEVITGFRTGLGGAQERFGVTPDLTVVAKAMGNGFPISAFGGRADLMEVVASNAAVHAGTYNGGGISVAAALATIGALRDDPETHARMRRLGTRLMDGLTASAREHGHALVAQGPGPVFFTWLTDAEAITSYAEHRATDAPRYARFAELMLSHGVRIIPAGRWYLTAAHDDADVDRALAAADRAFAELEPL